MYTPNLYGVFVNNILVGFCETLFISHIPTEKLKHWVNEFLPCLRFVVSRARINVLVLLKAVS